MNTQAIKTYQKEIGEGQIHMMRVTPRNDQMHRHIEVAQRDQRFDTVLFTLFKDRTVKSNALLIGRDFIALRKETAPGN